MVRRTVAIGLVAALLILAVPTARSLLSREITIPAAVGRTPAELSDARRFQELTLRMSYAYAEAVFATVAIEHLDPLTLTPGRVRQATLTAEAKWRDAQTTIRAFDALVASLPDVALGERVDGRALLDHGKPDAAIALADGGAAVIGKAPVTAELRAAGGILERNVAHYMGYLRHVEARVGDKIGGAVDLTFKTYMENRLKANEVFEDVVFTAGGVTLGLAFLPSTPVLGTIAVAGATYEGARVALGIGRGAVAIGVPIGLASDSTQATIVKWHERLPGAPPLDIPDALMTGGRWLIGAGSPSSRLNSEIGADVSAVSVPAATAEPLPPGATVVRNLQGYRVTVRPDQSTITIVPEESVVVGSGITADLARQLFPAGAYLVNGQRVTVDEKTFSNGFRKLVRELDQLGAVPRGDPTSPPPTRSPAPTPSPQPTNPLRQYVGVFGGALHTAVRDIRLTMSIYETGDVGGVDLTQWPFAVTVLDPWTNLPTGEIVDCTVVAELKFQGKVDVQGRIVARQNWLVTRKCQQSRYDNVSSFSLGFTGQSSSHEPGSLGHVEGTVPDPTGAVAGFASTYSISLSQR